MSSDIFEEIVSRHLQLEPGVFVRVGHNLGDRDWVGQIDILAMSFTRKSVHFVEVKSGGLHGLADQVRRYEDEYAPRVLENLGLSPSAMSEWAVKFSIYTKSDFHDEAWKAVAGRPRWNVVFLEDAFTELLNPNESL